MNLRESIFCHEMFYASNIIQNRSFGSDNIRQQEETWHFSEDEFHNELSKLKNEGLIEEYEISGGAYFKATPQGLITREKNYQNRELRHPALVRKSCETTDLIIALMSCDDGYGGEALEYSEFNIDKLYIYLWNVDREKIEEAIKTLKKEGLIEKNEIEFFDGNYHYLTAKGRIKYFKTIVPKLKLCPPHTILDNIQKLSPPFAGEYAKNLKYRWGEAEKCTEAELWLSATTMYGSILETILIGILQERRDVAFSSIKSPKKQSIESWRLDDLLKVSEDIGIIDKSLAGYAHVLRDARNLIHPSKQIKESNNPNRESTHIARQVVSSIVETVFHSAEESRQDT